MEVIDLTLFQFDSLPIKCRNKTYLISTIPAAIELKLLHIQASSPEIISSNFKKLDESILSDWKKLVKDLIILNNLEIDETDINELSPLQMLTLITALNKIIDKRASMMGTILNSSDGKKKI
jgi:hypothetical protein